MERRKKSSPPLFSHKRWSHKEGCQKCVRYVGLEKHDYRYRDGFPICAMVVFRFPVTRYTPRTSEIAKLLASLRILYGDEYMEELNALAEVEYLKMRKNREWEKLLKEVDE